MVDLQRRHALSTSRVSTYAKPPEDLLNDIEASLGEGAP
jgi:hypothetical protein